MKFALLSYILLTLATPILGASSSYQPSGSTVEPTSLVSSVISVANNATNSSSVSTSSEHCLVDIKLYARPTKGQFGRTGVTHYHEGAGIDYLFLSGDDSPKYIFDKCTHQIYILLSGEFKQFLSQSSGFVQLTVSGPSGDFQVVEVNGVNRLSVNGQTDGWLGCKNTNDPYGYSKNLYQLAFTGTSYTDCIPLTVEVGY